LKVDENCPKGKIIVVNKIIVNYISSEMSKTSDAIGISEEF